MQADYWKQKVCLVTGASSGLGLAIAKALAKREARVVLTAREVVPLEQAAQTLRAAGDEAQAIAADVTQQDQVDRLAEQIGSQYGRLDLLCNCAGRSDRKKVIETTPDDFQQLLDVNFLAAVRTTRTLAPLLIERQGHVVNIGSLACKVAPRFMGAYPASKFALAAYSQQLRLELGPAGLHVLLVCPGPIAREQSAARYANQTADLPAAAQQPGAGAKLRGIDPDRLAEKILVACQRRRLELIMPGGARLLFALSQISPRLGDWLLRRATSG